MSRAVGVLAQEYLAEHRAVLAAEGKVVVDKWTAEGSSGSGLHWLHRT
jgi:hypothetical protein